jgi:multiple sugar transport system permease protein
MNKYRLLKLLRFLLIYIALAAFIFPIFWMFSTSFKKEVDAFRYPPTIFSTPTLVNYSSVVRSEFPLYILNSVIVCSVTVFISIVLGAPASYALSRYNFKNKRGITNWILTTRMAPPVAVALPMFLLMKFFNLLDTRLALIILYTTFNLSFVIWLMRGFFEEVPRELDEAALIDGCSPVKAFLRIVLPLVAPGLAAVAIFCFIFSWNEFFYALIMTHSKSRTVPVGVQGFIGLYGIKWGEMTAAASLATVPILAFAIATQKHLVRGLTLGAVK